MRRKTSVRGATYIVHFYADDSAGKAGLTMCKRDASKVNCCCSECGRWIDVCHTCQDNHLLANIEAHFENVESCIASLGDVARHMNVSLPDLSETFWRLHLCGRINLCATIAHVADELGIETIEFDGKRFSGVSMRKRSTSTGV